MSYQNFFLIITVVALFSCQLFAQTEVEGDVDGLWTVEDSPYIVTDDIRVRGGEELVIEPGVEVMFDGAYTFTINGLLMATGEEENMILFSSGGNDEWWRSIRMNGADDGCVLSFCIFERSENVGEYPREESRGGALYAVDCENLSVTNNIFRNNSGQGEGGAACFYESSGEFTNNHIYENFGFTEIVWFEICDMPVGNNLVENNDGDHGAGIIISHGSSLVENNIIRFNTSNIMGWGCGLYFEEGSESRVYNNLIYGNVRGGVYIGVRSNITDFDHNVIFGNDGGPAITLYADCHLEIQNSIIWDHGDVIWIPGGDCTVEASYSLIQNAENEEIDLGDGMLDEDPAFVDPDEDDFSLADDSPCRDAGDPDSPDDPDGTRADIGLVFPHYPVPLQFIPERIDFGQVAPGLDAEMLIFATYNPGDEDAPEIVLLIDPVEDWVGTDPDELELAPGDTVDMDLFLFLPDDYDQFGEQFTIVTFFPDVDNFMPLEVPVFFNVVEGFGSVSGAVTDAESDDSLEGIEVILSGQDFHAQSDDTDREGHYSFDRIPAGDYTVVIEHEDYAQYQSQNINVEPNDDIQLDIRMFYATCDIETESISAEVRQDESAEYAVNIVNNGNAPLRYSIDKRFPQVGDFENWDMRESINAEQQCDDTRLQGVEFDGESIYVAGGNNGAGQGRVHIFDANGEYQDSFDQFTDSRWGMRDLAWDGDRLYGGDGSDVYAFTPGGELRDQFDTPVDLIYGITWDPINELLWLCGVGTNLYGITREGEVISEIENNPDMRILGLGTHSDDPDEGTIYAFCRNGEFETQVNKVNPLTGEWMFVADLETDEDLRAGGICITNELDPMSYVLIGLMHGRNDERDVVGIWQLSPYSKWLQVDPESGSIEDDDFVELSVNLDASGVDVGMGFAAELIVNHDGRGDDVILPITMEVLEPNAVQNDDDLPPTNYTLNNPYPNPFNDQVRISFGMPEAGAVRVAVFDVNGRMVTTLLEGRSQPGFHQVAWRADGSPNGLYFIKLEAGKTQLVQRVVLMK